MEEYLRLHFSYNPETGEISRTDRVNGCGSLDNYGNIIMKVKGKPLKAHRVAWFLYHGSFPSEPLYHVNGNNADNRICNLRYKSEKPKSDKVKPKLNLNRFRAENIEKYEKIYNDIILRAKKRRWGSVRYSCFRHLEIPDFPTETHHVIPRSIGGDDSENNLVVLTLKEHFICHYLLCRIYPDCIPLNVAFNFMINRTKGKNAKGYEKYRTILAEESSKRLKEYWKDDKRLESNAEMMRKRMKDPEYLEKIEQGRLKLLQDSDRMNAMKEKLSKLWEDEEFRKMMSDKMKEVRSDPDYKRKMSESIKKQNKERPDILAKRMKGIAKHQKVKSEEWKKKCSKWSKEYMNRPEVKERFRMMSTGINSSNARKVYCFDLDCVFFTAVYASKELGINLSTLKKWMNKKIVKYKCVWYDDYLKGDFQL